VNSTSFAVLWHGPRQGLQRFDHQGGPGLNSAGQRQRMGACLKRGSRPFHHGLRQHDRRRRPVPGLPVRPLDDVLRVAGPKPIATIPWTVQGGEGMDVGRLDRVTCLVLDQNVPS
jgi:hypothetical protein